MKRQEMRVQCSSGVSTLRSACFLQYVTCTIITMLERKVVLLVASCLLVQTALADWEHDASTLNHRTLLFSAPQSYASRSRSAIPWRYLARQEVSTDSNESGSAAAAPDSAGSAESVEPLVQSEEQESAEVVPETRVPLVPVIPGPGQKGESGSIVVRKKQQQQNQDSSQEEDRDELVDVANDYVSFSYYPISQVFDNSGSVVYEIQDTELRSARGGGWGKGKKKKGCKKGKKGKKGKGKGKKKKGKKGCQIKGGWWYYYDKKHGYVSGRWGSPPPKGLEREHYVAGNYGKFGHGYGIGYNGAGQMGWKVSGWGGGHHGGGHHGGGHGGGGGYGGFGGYGGGYGHHHPHHHQNHHGWGPVTHYGWGWAEKVKKGWGWRR